MTEEIKYQGVTANPSDYDCQDGTLALSLNLWPENGSLKPVLPPEKLLTSPYEIVCVHKTSAFTHYIALSANSESDYDLYFHDGNTDTATSIGNISSKVREVTPIGNTLVVLTDGKTLHTSISANTFQNLILFLLFSGIKFLEMSLKLRKGQVSLIGITKISRKVMTHILRKTL